MKKIFLEIWKQAKPYYKKGRIYDVHHITWMMNQGDKIGSKININKDILMPLIILHDVAYHVKGERNPKIADKDSKIVHMREGAKIARLILNKVHYDSLLTNKIVNYISVHDNWALGDDTPYKESKEMALFTDLDFLSAQSSYSMLKYHGKALKKTPDEMYYFWLHNDKPIKRPFCCKETKELFNSLMKALKLEIEKIK